MNILFDTNYLIICAQDDDDDDALFLFFSLNCMYVCFFYIKYVNQ